MLTLRAHGIDLISDEGRIRVDSREIAERFGKEHKNVLAAVRELECSAEFIELNFKPNTYTDSIGRRLPCYYVTAEGFMFLVMGFTGREAAAVKERFIAAFKAARAELLRRQKETQGELQQLQQVNSKLDFLTGIATETRHDVRSIADQQVVVLAEVRRTRGKRMEISLETKDRHRHVLREMGNRCPLCHASVGEVQFDHFYENQRADFESTWPLCKECHDALTFGRRSRTSAETQFHAYQKFAHEILPTQGSLF